MLTRLMNPGESAINVPSLRRALLAAAGLIWALAPAPARAQPDDPDDTGEETGGDSGDSGGAPAQPQGAPAQPQGALLGDPDTLVCNGGWRYSLAETREEIGPARFARQLSLQRDIALVAGAFGYCETAAQKGFSGDSAAAAGPCYGLLGLANQVAIVASNLFENSKGRACQCLSDKVDGDPSCEGLREQLPTLRRFDDIIVDRAELALAYEVCASVERDTNSGLAAACAGLEQAVAAEHQGRRGAPGQFSLAAPLPAQVAAGVARVRIETDGRYLSMLPENFMGVRRSICEVPAAPQEPGRCQLRGLDEARRKGGPPGGAGPDLWGKKRGEVLMGMCNELVLADSNAGTCRSADIYIDERGELHLNRSLTTREQRKRATLCIDISDFDDDHPLMVTLGLDPTGSVPERVWPGETMHIGRLIDRPVTPEDILRIHVLGKARGISLAEVLRVNGVPGYTSETMSLRQSAESRKEACRIARAWVPVVDHEVPVGTPARQAIIPLTFGRGRDGETQRIQEGDYVVLWVRDIEPAGTILAEYADGQTVGYQPPPLLGEPDAGTKDSPRTPRPGAAMRGAGAGVSQPLLPRRARYPGSRVLRLGTPAGNNLYNLKVCTRNQAAGAQTRTCAELGGTIIMNEKLFVHGTYHFGLRMYFGYSYFPVPRLVGRRTPAAESAGDNVFEVVESGGGTADYDVAVLLAVYPFGRDPRRFSYKPWTRTYWSHAALLTGFTVRRLQPWEDFYAGASLPVANGVSLSLLSHFSRRQIPVDVQAGELFTAPSESSNLGLENFFDTRGALVVGASVGLTMDFDLFERAFSNTWQRLSGQRGQFLSSSAQPSSLVQPDSSALDSYGDE